MERAQNATVAENVEGDDKFCRDAKFTCLARVTIFVSGWKASDENRKNVLGIFWVWWLERVHYEKKGAMMQP